MTEVTSPCIRNCCLDGNDICLGCHRSLQEILEWGSSSVARQLAIIQLAKARQLQTSKGQSQVSSNN